MKKLLIALGGVLMISSPAKAITWGEFWEPFTDNDKTHVHVQGHTYKGYRYHHTRGSHSHCHNHYRRGYSHCHWHSHRPGSGHHGRQYMHGRKYHGHHIYRDHYHDGDDVQIIIR